jgi:hypothetical protein
MKAETAERRPSRDIPPKNHGLWSLWKLMEIVAIGDIIKLIHTLVGEAALGTDDTAPLHPNARIVLKKCLTELLPHCEKLNLVVPTHYVKSGLETVCQAPTAYEVGMIARTANFIVNTIQIEMAGRACLVVNADRAKFFSSPDLFGDAVEYKFPSASPEIMEAGKCYALGRYSASVYHLMRVLEIGLKCLATATDVTFANQNWQNVIDQIEKNIRSMTAQTHGENWRADEQYYSEAAAYFRILKTAWRNYAMHMHERYDEERATDIFNNVRGFMRHLATKLSEPDVFVEQSS